MKWFQMVLAIGLCGVVARAGEATTQRAMELQKRAALEMALAGEILQQPEGVHRLKDGTILIKAGKGMVIVKPDGGMGIGRTGGAMPPGNDAEGQWQVGLFLALFQDTGDLEKLGISADLAKELKATFSKINHEPDSDQGVQKAGV
jgi:hypothetical protein